MHEIFLLALKLKIITSFWRGSAPLKFGFSQTLMDIWISRFRFSSLFWTFKEVCYSCRCTIYSCSKFEFFSGIKSNLSRSPVFLCDKFHENGLSCLGVKAQQTNLNSHL